MDIIKKMTIDEFIDVVKKGRSLTCYYQDDTYNYKVREAIDALNDTFTGLSEKSHLNNCINNLLEKINISKKKEGIIQ